jgi:hypothetical protein
MCSAKNIEQIFLFCKSLSKIFLVVAFLPTPRLSASGLMVFLPTLHQNGASFLHIFVGPNENWPARTRMIFQQFPAILKTLKHSEDSYTMQSSPQIFSGIGKIRWQFFPI